MKLELRRIKLTEHGTTGELYVDGVFECFTLEDTRRAPGEPKVPGKTAIPEGNYFVIVNKSPRFGVDMPLVLGVRDFSGVRFHPGNHPSDTEGCILVGRQVSTKVQDEILESRPAYEQLFKKLQAAQDRRDDVVLAVRLGPGVSTV